MPKLREGENGHLAQSILDAYNDPSGPFVGAIIEGQLRTGKTVYAIKTMRDVFRTLDGSTNEEAYKKAIETVNFELDPFLESIGRRQLEIKNNLPKIDWKMRYPCRCLDDSSLYAGTDLYFRDLSLYSSFSNCMTTVGSATSGMLITAPAKESLSKPLREYYNYLVVSIVKCGGWEREAVIKEWYPHGMSRTLRLREVARDCFTAHIPTEQYAMYLAPRLEKGVQAVHDALAASRAKATEVTGPTTEIEGAATEVLKLKPGPRSKKQPKRRHLPRPAELAGGKLDR